MCTKKLSSDKLLVAVFEEIKKRFLKRAINIHGENYVHKFHTNQCPLALIGDDSDDHRIRAGFMRYEEMAVVRINNTCWAIALGSACGDYPADPYSKDITAVQMDEIPVPELLKRSCYFLNSLIASKRFGGELFFMRYVGSRLNPFGTQMVEFLEKNWEGNFQRVGSHEQEFVNVVVDGIIHTLSNFVEFDMKDE
ncbi:MAG: hypothetical protein HZA35_01705 [Parcubacteria group bacterium]|nr:hypothetical protein [Parcubacteria group bacterium]